MVKNRIVSKAEATAARLELLEMEKQYTRRGDELSRLRRQLPWFRIDKDYTFDSPDGKRTLADLFQGRSQLAVYHFMFGPGWEQGCPSCSMAADSLNPNAVHLEQRDVSLVVVSRAPLDQIESFRRRMGWSFHWVSSFANDFNFDFQVSFTRDEIANGSVNYNYAIRTFGSEEAHGLSVFHKDEAGSIYHTYSSYGRGLDPLLIPYFVLDRVPKGRDEDGLHFTMAWVRHHDRYPQPEVVR